MLNYLNPATVVAPFSRYSQAVAVPAGYRWLYISGQVGATPAGTILAGFEAQAAQCWANIAAILAADAAIMILCLDRRERLGRHAGAREQSLGWRCRQLAAESGDDSLEKVADTIERVVREEKKLPPNLDWPSARLYHYLGLEVDLYTPLFVASRVAGWSAHVIEQAGNNRLIRPRSRYIGPAPKEFVRLEDRG